MATPSMWRARLARRLTSPVLWQGALGILCFFLVWQFFRSVGVMVVMPGPFEVLQGIPKQVAQEGYFASWVASSRRVFLGFFIAAILALALGVTIGVSRKVRFLSFPILEVMRPIPPLAWLPLAILFWPTAETTMTFLTFMGAFFPIFINVLAGIDNIDARYVQAAMSLGASRRSLLLKILGPGALPAVFTGLTISIAITWEVVIAAEMASANEGLGYLTWNAYMSQSMIGIVIGMLSIGLAGMISSALMSWLGYRAMPWRHR